MRRAVESRKLRVESLAAFLFVFLLASGAPQRAAAQFIGYAAQQVVTRDFFFPAGVPTQGTLSFQNIGQAGHTVVYWWVAGGAGNCTLSLQGSFDGAVWTTIAAGPDALNSVGPRFTFANGYFSIMRINVNPNFDAACQSSLHGSYTGYQSPLPITKITNTIRVAAIAAPTPINTNMNVSTPAIIEGFECYNPDNQGTAYLQIFASAVVPPALGGPSMIFEVAIPTLQTYSYPGPAFHAGQSRQWAGAATALGGNVAVGTPLVCNFQLNYRGPFYPVTDLQ